MLSTSVPSAARRWDDKVQWLQPLTRRRSRELWCLPGGGHENSGASASRPWFGGVPFRSPAWGLKRGGRGQHIARGKRRAVHHHSTRAAQIISPMASRTGLQKQIRLKTRIPRMCNARTPKARIRSPTAAADIADDQPPMCKRQPVADQPIPRSVFAALLRLVLLQLLVAFTAHRVLCLTGRTFSRAIGL